MLQYVFENVLTRQQEKIIPNKLMAKTELEPSVSTFSLQSQEDMLV